MQIARLIPINLINKTEGLNLRFWPVSMC